MRARVKTYITDYGHSINLTPDELLGEGLQLARYGVWKWCASKGRYELVQTGVNLADLQKSFGPCQVRELKQKAV